MAGKRQFNPHDVAQALIESGGIIDGAAKHLGCDWHTVKTYIKEYPVVAEAHKKGRSNRKGRARRPRAKARFVYLIRDELMHMTKIGVTSDPQRRLWDLRIGCPQDLELVGVVETAHPKKLEKELHSRFAHKLHKGEWFNLSQDDIDLILDYHNGAAPFEVPLFHFSQVGEQ